MAEPRRGRGGRRGAKIRAYLGLSRAPHAALDMATPAVAALLWLGRFPSLGTCLIGLGTVFAGYIAVYALNDLADCRQDASRLREGAAPGEGYLDAALPLHPIALGLIGRQQALAWVVAWGVAAAVGSAVLNPLCLAVFVGGCVLEVAYCRLCSVTPWRAAVSGVVKTLGAFAAVLAVDRHPAAGRLALLVLWVFLWEIGGQNIPSDWADLERDRRLGARTIPVSLGPVRAAALVVASLAAAVGVKLVLATIGPAGWRLPYALASAAIGAWLLLAPAARLAVHRDHERVVELFNRASWYPLALLAAMTVRVLV